MRLNHHLAVFSLFLLVPASIICAQTAYLTGTVSVEQDYRVIQFNSPNGQIKVILPGDLSGTSQGTYGLHGTVWAEPSGKTDKEKASSLKTIQKLILKIGGKSISILPGQYYFDFSLPDNLTTPVSIDLEDPKGQRATLTVKYPFILPPAVTGEIPAGQKSLFTDQKIFLTNGYIPVYAANTNSTLFQATDQFFIKDASGKITEATLIAQSPVQTVLSSQGVKPGAVTIVRQKGSSTDQVKIRLADLSLSSPNTNLRKGQTSSLTVTIDPKITDKDSAEAMQIPIMSLDIKNLTPDVIEMSGGNYQVMTLPAGPNTGNKSTWQVTRTITGVTPGSFNVSAALYPSTENTNAVHAQLDAVKTPEEFNNWANAIKKDLRAYLKAIPLTAISVKDFAQQAIDFLPMPESDADVSEAKMIARRLFRSLPEFTTNIAGEGYAAFEIYKSASDRLKNPGARDERFFHMDVIESGLHFIQQNTGVQSYTQIEKQVNDALQAANVVQYDYSANNLGALSTALLSLNNTPVVAGLADVDAVLYPHIVEADGPIGARMSDHEVTPDNQLIRFYDDGAVIIYANGIRYIFKAVTANGTSVKSLMEKFDNPGYPMPVGVDCDSLKKICRKTEALNVFWGDIYSITNDIQESGELKGVTMEKNSQTSLLLTRGWEMDCCKGLFRLKLFFQTMGPGQTFSFQKILNQGTGSPCPIPDECPRCKEKCEAEKN